VVWRYAFIGTVALGLMTTVSTAIAQLSLDLGGTFDCVGRPVSNGQLVRVNCSQEVRRGNRIFTTTAAFTLPEEVGKYYLGKHRGCLRVKAEETRINQEIIACEGVPTW
jgi:hypothetical protein